jgi:hypothetical protein
MNPSTTKPLASIPRPTPLDRLALYLLEEKNGRPRGFAVQTALEFVGLPTVFSVADALGILRGYLNLRQGQRFKGRLQIFLAILPGIPTGPVHYLIEYLFPDRPGLKPAL